MVETALRNFSAGSLVAIIDQLATAALDARKQPALRASGRGSSGGTLTPMTR